MIRLLSILVVFVMLHQCVKAPPSKSLQLRTNIESIKAALEEQIKTNEANIELGRQTYVANCIRCHNVNPRLPGNLGPELYTTPKEVFHTKVPDGKYPEGYVPKRKTRVMPKFKHLTNKVDQIYLYIRSTKE